MIHLILGISILSLVISILAYTRSNRSFSFTKDIMTDLARTIYKHKNVE